MFSFFPFPPLKRDFRNQAFWSKHNSRLSHGRKRHPEKENKVKEDLKDSFPNFEPVHSSMSSSNCCFLTCIQVSQAGKVVWYSRLLKNFPQFVVIHKVKGFSIINEAEVDAFLEFPCFFYDSTDVGNLISGSSAFSKSSLYIWKFLVYVLLKPT